MRLLCFGLFLFSQSFLSPAFCQEPYPLDPNKTSPEQNIPSEDSVKTKETFIADINQKIIQLEKGIDSLSSNIIERNRVEYVKALEVFKTKKEDIMDMLMLYNDESNKTKKEDIQESIIELEDAYNDIVHVFSKYAPGTNNR